MRTLWVVAIVLAAACGSKQPEPKPVTNEPPAKVEPAPVAVTKGGVPTCNAGEAVGACVARAMTSVSDEMCACADETCAQGVYNNLMTFAEEWGPKLEATTPTDAEQAVIDERSERLGECMSKLVGVADGASDRAEGQYKMKPSDSAPEAPAEEPVYKKVRTMKVGKKPGKQPVCGKKESQSACTMKMMTYWKDLMCACPDKYCGETVTAELTAWAQEFAKTSATKKQEKTVEADMKKMEEVGKQLGECMVDVVMTDPKAP